MPNPAVIRQVVEVSTKGALSLLAGEAIAARRRRPIPETAALATAREQLLAEHEKLVRTESLVPVPDAAPFLETGGAAMAEQISAAAARPLPPLGEVRLGEAMGNAEVRPTLPDKLFADIVGLDEAKRTLRTVVTSERQLHAVLIGKPGSGKSALMEDLGTLPDATYVIGQNVTSAGLLDLIVGPHATTRILLFDEIEKAKPETLTTLLGMMTGKATRTVSGQHQEVDTDVRVVAACNTIETLPVALRSRLIEVYLPEYTEAERKEVIAGFLERRQGLSAAKAKEVADLVAPVSADIRDAEQIAEVDKTDPILAKQIAAGLRREGAAAETPPRGHKVTDKRAPR
ncbi:MAG: AAA family ATPase [Solirubrobacteraceae bacterium]